MNQQIIDYLQTNKDNYTKESLIIQLQKAGYDNAEITEAVNNAYGDTEVSVKIPNGEADQNEIKYAGFWIRFVAMIIDGLVLSLLFIIVILFSILLTIVNVSIPPLLGQLFIFICSVLYFVLMTNKYQATLGKKVVGIKICDVNTLSKASSNNIIIREIISRLFLTIPFLALLHTVVAFTRKKQGLHDMTAKTVVVYKN